MRQRLSVLIPIFMMAVAGCRTATVSTARTQVRMAIGPTPWVTTLLSIYANQIQDVAFSRIDIPNSTPALDYIEEGMADISIVPADIVYIAFNKGTETKPFPHKKLRGMAVMHMAAVHLISADRVDIRSLKDLRGRRVGIGPTGTSTQLTTPLLLTQIGLSARDVQLERVTYEDAARRMINGTMDAAFIFSAFPAEQAETLVGTPGTHLVSLPQPEISALREKFPFLRPVSIPKGTYGITHSIETLGVNFVLVCGETLEQDVVYRLINVFFESIPELSKQRAALRDIAFDHAPGAPIPLHLGAERFYRERQLFN